MNYSSSEHWTIYGTAQCYSAVYLNPQLTCGNQNATNQIKTNPQNYLLLRPTFSRPPHKKGREREREKQRERERLRLEAVHTDGRQSIYWPCYPSSWSVN